MYIMKYLFGLKLINMSERVLHKIAGKLCLSALVNSAVQPERGCAFRNGFSENIEEKYVFFSFVKLLLLL